MTYEEFKQNIQERNFRKIAHLYSETKLTAVDVLRCAHKYYVEEKASDPIPISDIIDRIALAIGHMSLMNN